MYNSKTFTNLKTAVDQHFLDGYTFVTNGEIKEHKSYEKDVPYSDQKSDGSSITCIVLDAPVIDDIGVSLQVHVPEVPPEQLAKQVTPMATKFHLTPVDNGIAINAESHKSAAGKVWATLGLRVTASIDVINSNKAAAK